MNVFIQHDRNRPALHNLFVTPASDVEFTKGEVPREWLDPEGKPLTITVTFDKGKASVPNNLGAYLIERGLARKTALIRPGD